MARRKRNQKQAEETLVDVVKVKDQAQNFLDENQNLIFGVLVGFVVLVGGFFAYRNFYQKPRQDEAVEQMFRAQEQFERDSFALALSNPGGGYMGFLDVIDSYKGTKAANLARYYAGISYLNLGKYEAALDYLKQYNADGDITPIMKFGAMGDAYAELNDMDKAMSHYKKAANYSDNEALTPYYLKKIGMLSEKNGDYAAAKEAYQEIKDKYPTSDAGRTIDKYLARIASKS